MEFPSELTEVARRVVVGSGELMLGAVSKLSLRVVVGSGVVEVMEALDARRLVLREVDWESLMQRKADIASRIAITTPAAAPVTITITTSILQS